MFKNYILCFLPTCATQRGVSVVDINIYIDLLIIDEISRHEFACVLHFYILLYLNSCDFNSKCIMSTNFVILIFFVSCVHSIFRRVLCPRRMLLL